MGQVETMSVELEDKKVVVAQAQKDCEELLVEIVSERRVADEQKKQASAYPPPSQSWRGVESSSFHQVLSDDLGTRTVISFF